MYFTKKNMQTLSSSITIFLKLLLIPFYVASTVALFLATVFFLPTKYNDLYIVVVPFWTVLASFAIYILSRVKVVCFDSESLIIFKGKDETRIDLNHVSSVGAVYPLLYKIRFIEGGVKRSVLFFPRLGEIVFKFKVKNSSIDRLKKIITRSSSSE